MAKSLTIANLGRQTEASELLELFAQFGTVVRAETVVDRATGLNTGGGVVEMSTDDEAQQAIAGMNGKAIDGRTLIVNEATP